MRVWLTDQVDEPLASCKEFKHRMQSLPTVKFVNRVRQNIKKCEKLSQHMPKPFKDPSDDGSFVHGSHLIQNFMDERDNYPNGSFSVPITVEGFVFQLVIYPNGADEDKETYLSVGL